MTGAPPGLATVAVELARAQLAAGRPLRTRAAGQSMWPWVRDGAAVTVIPLAGSPLAVGDVVLVALASRLVLHRVIRVAGDIITTKGDAVAWPDPPVTRCDVLGRLRGHRWDRWVARASRAGGAPLARIVGLSRRLAGRAPTAAWGRWRPPR
ncbi:MAG: hypothetical protein CVU56_09385 [Deltaproteobacteria bacterium HGW-Deltaproteobacteria-14]|nr:MAG: hypothetical protein CVU56_09385 [Deltaproteobacteria bacterium HGW-Deltaproteobacteria-14]